MQPESSAWHPEDPAWVKKRKSEWRLVKKNLDKLNFIRKKEITFLKDFFLTGTVNMAALQEYCWGHANPKRPLQFVEGAVLLECWLSPDHSEANWQRIKQKYSDYEGAWNDAKRRFMEIASRLPGGYVALNGDLVYYGEDGESFFSGLEERLYRFLMPTRCRREDFPGISDDDYLDKAKGCAGITWYFLEFLDQDPPNPYNITRFRVAEWHDGRVATQLPFRAPEGAKVSNDIVLVQAVDRIRDKPTNYDPLHVQLANELAEALEDPALGQSVLESIAEIRAQPQTFEQRLIPGAWATLYVKCHDQTMRDRILYYLPGQKIPLPEEGGGPYEGLSNMNGLRKPRSVRKDGDHAFELEWRMGPTADLDVWVFKDAIGDRAQVYAYFDSEEGQNAYFRIEGEGLAICIYRQGQDSQVDEVLATLADASERLKRVVERFGG